MPTVQILTDPHQPTKIYIQNNHIYQVVKNGKSSEEHQTSVYAFKSGVKQKEEE